MALPIEIECSTDRWVRKLLGENVMSDGNTDTSNTGSTGILGYTRAEFWGMVGALVAIVGVAVAVLALFVDFKPTVKPPTAMPPNPTVTSPPPSSTIADTWDARHKAIAAAFPQLVGSAGAPTGFGGATCIESDPQSSESSYWLTAGATRIRCEVTGNGMLFDVMDVSGTRSGGEGSQAFAQQILVDAVQEQRDHPSAGRGLTVTTRRGAGADSTSSPAFVVTSFPAADPRSPYVVVARWVGHSAGDLIETWWRTAPLGSA
ncbi:hypothetical protein [Nocardia sp. NPDC058480]|uniref:hypothetical protein n=1 Tax=unclassified Nocardia TaxID=2637762 RepID=UPI0036480175